MADADLLTGSHFWVDIIQYWERWSHWKWLQTPLMGAAVSDAGGLIAQIDWPHIWPAIGLAITAIGTAVLGLWRYYRLTQIEILIKQREADGWLPPKGTVIDTATVVDRGKPPAEK